MNLEDATRLIAALLGISSLIFVGYNTLAISRAARARFWLELRAHIERYDEVHLALRPRGKWIITGSGPSTPEDWAKVEAYLGFLEHCEKMVQDGLIDGETFKRIYGHRIAAIRNNSTIIAEKLSGDAAQYYELFLSLAKRMGYDFPQG